jgi:thiamine pyrophosphate-dependent acetolactate synthase large subunit-like protein
VTRAQAVELVLALLRVDDLVVAADGAISREAYRGRDRLRTFYMLGSMGQVASLALGLALARRERVVALDGDGNLLMGLGGLALVAAKRPANLFHVVLDNCCYATTGGQATVSRQVDLAALANSAGYSWARRCRAGEDAAAAVRDWLAATGPAFLLLEIEPGDPDPAPRIPMTPVEMGERFRAALGSPVR